LLLFFSATFAAKSKSVMIQRIQTVYLTVASLLGILALLNPVAIYLKGSEAVVLTPFSHTAEEVVDFAGAWPIGVLWVFCIAVLVATIFQFKNRPLQLKITMSFTILLIALGAMEFWIAMQLGAALGEGYNANYNWTIFLPFISAVLTFLARLAIKKDEDLVRSVDRLR